MLAVIDIGFSIIIFSQLLAFCRIAFKTGFFDRASSVSGLNTPVTATPVNIAVNAMNISDIRLNG